jgi:L-methionine (R)-S-oxide reductase
MAEELFIPSDANRKAVYEALWPQLQSVVAGESNAIANASNIMAVLKEAFQFLWVGVYYVAKDNPQQLVLGPFQGPLACTRIAYGKGVCGTAWKENRTIIVDDVEQFPGHIACSSKSKSEVVVPIRNGNDIIGVLDVDSEHLGDFSEVDAFYLEQIANLLGNLQYA